METALSALFRAVRQRAVTSDEAWGSRVFPVMAPSKTERPYLIYNRMGGGEVNESVRPDAVIVLSIKVVADTLAESLTLAGRISALYNDADRGSDKQLDGGNDWWILNSQQEQDVQLTELVDSQWRYHAGAHFRFRLYAK